MLVLSRKRDQSIMIGPDIELTVVEIKGDQVKLGIKAPGNVTIHRKEVFLAIETENRAAALRSGSVDLAAMRKALGTPAPAPKETEPDQG